MNYFLNIVLYFIAIIIKRKNCINSENYSIIFPFITIPNKDPELTSFLNITTMNNIMKNIFLHDIYIKIELGSPPQVINLRLSINIDDFFISKNNTIYEEQYPIKNGNFYFNEFKSETYGYQTEERGHIYFSHRHLSEYAKDNFYFYFTNNKKITIPNFPFFLAYKVNGPNHGIIGLKGGLSEDGKMNDIFSLLQDNSLIRNNIWYLYYNNKYNGSLFFGNYPHHDKNIIKEGKNEYLKINHFRKIYTIINEKNPENQWGLNFEKIYLRNITISSTIDQEILNNCKTCKKCILNPNFGIIIAPQKFKFLFENIYMNKYLNNKKCFQPMLEMILKGKKKTYYYYYCDSSYLQEMKKDFQPIIFEHKEFLFNFTINFDDLYVQKNNYIFFKIIFDVNQQMEWILGDPFFNKYFFVFNSDSKEIGFYSKNINDNIFENNNGKEGKNSLLSILIKLIIGFLLVILGIIIGKKLFGLRRKLRANELEDKFEYKSVGRQNQLF